MTNKDTLTNDANKLIKVFPNGFISWQETHFEVIQAITQEWLKDEPEGLVAERQEEQGHGGLYELATELTDEFEELNKDVLWGEDKEYFDEIEKFLDEKLK